MNWRLRQLLFGFDADMTVRIWLWMSRSSAIHHEVHTSATCAVARTRMRCGDDMVSWFATVSGRAAMGPGEQTGDLRVQMILQSTSYKRIYLEAFVLHCAVFAEWWWFLCKQCTECLSPCPVRPCSSIFSYLLPVSVELLELAERTARAHVNVWRFLENRKWRAYDWRLMVKRRLRLPASSYS